MSNLLKETAAFITAYLLLLSVVIWWALLIITCSPLQVPLYVASIILPSLKGWAYNLIISQDQTVNAIHGGNMDTHISGRIGFHAKRGARVALHMERPVNLIFLITDGQKNHCRNAIEFDEKYHRHMGR
jgi:hypothetical protein